MILIPFLYIFTIPIYCNNTVIPKTTDYNLNIPFTYNNSIDNIINEIKTQIDETISKDEVEKILIQAKNKINLLKNKEKIIYREENFQKALLDLRKAILRYFIKTNKYPLTLDELIPNFIDLLPEINIHGEWGTRIKHIRTIKYDRKYQQTIDDTTEYIYFSDPQSIYWGLIIINSQKELNEIPLYKY